MTDIESIRRAHEAARPDPTANPAWFHCERDIGVLLAEIDRLNRERDAWAAKWHRVRAELAELKYPGMKGVIRPLGE